jgi:iron complex outermembrane receptor protein
MKHFSKRLLSAAVLAAMTTTAATAAETTAAEQAAENEMMEEVVTIGTRNSKPRTATQSTVPIDVFSEADLAAFGNQADLTDTLKSLVPSYTATPATGDGSAFIRPTSLRGMAPDQALIMVNGKRRHRSSLVQFFAPAAGNGAHGVDVGMIPSIAVKSIEVLRDGAAAQYGSDAIAGVINFQLKDAGEGGKALLQYGEFFEGEQSMMFAANAGFTLAGNGFVNLSFETNDNDALSRGIQRPDAQALINAGVVGVGADSPFDDAPFAQSWGRPETSGNRFFVNSGFDIGDTSELYVHGGYADTEGRYRFFYRNPSHSTLTNVTSLPAGYTPFLDGEQTDITFVAGLKGELGNEMFYDISVGYGQNELEYYLNNTVNSSLVDAVAGTPGQRGFNMGGYEQEEININADFSKALTDNVNLAFGAEWREETFTTNAGEPNSYFGAGPSGMTSVSPTDAGEFDRSNYAVYVDVEHDISDQWLMQYALRYEDFSDFGDTINGKLATRYSFTDSFTLRAAVSTGFHAPTPGQANISSIITTFDGTTGNQVEEGLVPPNSALALQYGGKDLTEETSVNYSLGFTSDLTEATTLTFDVYLVEVDDRIYRTSNIALDPTDPNGPSLSYYTNALDVEHQGFDLVLTSSFDWSQDAYTTASFAFNYNKIEVTGQTAVNGINPVSDALIEDIENNYPEERFVINTMTHFAERWTFMARLNYYGEHYDERGTINSATSPSAKIDSIFYVDLELGVDITDNFNITAGGANVFDEYVDDIDAPNANRNSVGLQYPRRTPANYEGGSWYLRGTYTF